MYDIYDSGVTDALVKGVHNYEGAPNPLILAPTVYTEIEGAAF